MSIESEADRLAYVQTFGQTVESRNGAFLAIFDSTAESLSFDEARITMAQPVIVARASDVKRLAIKREDLLVIDDVEYRAARIEPDGTGMMAIVLEATK